MKNEFVPRAQRIMGCTVVAIVSLNFSFAWSASDDDLDLPLFLAQQSLIVAVSCYMTGRLYRRAAVLCPAPAGDLQLLLSKLSAVLAEFGYCALNTGVEGRWEFEGSAGKRNCGPFFPVRNVSVEAVGPAVLRITGAAATIQEVRKQVPGTVAAQYTGPQPWRARGKGFLIPCAIALAGLALSIVVYVLIRDPSSTGPRRRAEQSVHSRPETPGRGSDIRIPLELTSAEAAQGGRKVIVVPGRTEKLALMLPQGIKDGRRLRLRGAGNPGIDGGSPGDLYLLVTVR